jgi:hypothetical protein
MPWSGSPDHPFFLPAYQRNGAENNKPIESSDFRPCLICLLLQLFVCFFCLDLRAFVYVGFFLHFLVACELLRVWSPQRKLLVLCLLYFRRWTTCTTSHHLLPLFKCLEQGFTQASLLFNVNLVYFVRRFPNSLLCILSCHPVIRFSENSTCCMPTCPFLCLGCSICTRSVRFMWCR